MKKYLIALIIGLSSTVVMAAAEEKTVCKDKMDKNGQVIKGKDGKPVQECRKIKVHKKVEGEKVPDKK